MRACIHALLGLGGFLCLAPGLIPCDCVPMTASAALSDPGIESVFLGVMISREEDEVLWGRTTASVFRFTFAVRAVWKGPVAETIEVLTPQEGTACGADFAHHVDYVIFAYQDGGALWTGSCSSFPAQLPDLVAEVGEPLWQTQEESPFRRGDVDASGGLNITDALRILGFLYLGWPEPGCLDAADSDDSGSVELTDAVLLLELLFVGDRTLPGPGATLCGFDATPDTIGCEVFPSCA